MLLKKKRCLHKDILCLKRHIWSLKIQRLQIHDSKKAANISDSCMFGINSLNKKKQQVEASTISIKQLDPYKYCWKRNPTKSGRTTLPLEIVEVMQHFLNHLGLILDLKVEHINTVLSKGNKMIALLQTFQHILTRHSLLAICKTFVRPNLDYGNVIYDKLLLRDFTKT